MLTWTIPCSSEAVNTLFPVFSSESNVFTFLVFGLRSWLNRRKIDGSLNRTPLGFYDRVWQILERTPNGIVVAGTHLPQVIISSSQRCRLDSTLLPSFGPSRSHVSLKALRPAFDRTPARHCQPTTLNANFCCLWLPLVVN